MINFVEYDSEQVLSRLVSKFEEVLGETLQPSDERRIFINQLAQVIIAQNAAINMAGNQVLLRYAKGEVLDEIGKMFGVDRLVAGYATTTLKFTLSAVQGNDIVIPQTTRVTPDGTTYFHPVQSLIIPAGQLEGTVGGIASVAGESGNNFLAGQIKYIVDNLGFLASVQNTTVSAGGSNEESDDSYRERIRISPESFSTAGCEDGYIYYAKSASADVGDVAVSSPEAGTVAIYVMKADGTIPASNDELLEVVKTKVSAKDVRPLTDKVIVSPPERVEYSIDLKYWVSASDITNLSSIQTAITKAVDEYKAWQGEKIGRDINPDKLRNLVLNAGASRVVLTAPVYTELTNNKVAVFKESNIAYQDLSE